MSRPEAEGGGGGVSRSGGDARVTASERRDVGGAEPSMLSMLIPLESAGSQKKKLLALLVQKVQILERLLC